MSTLSHKAGQLNSTLASVCFGAHSSCTSSCAELLQKYKNRLASCEGCETESVLESTLQTLQASQRACDGLKSKSDQLAMTGLTSASPQAMADYCKTASAAAAPTTSPNPAPVAAMAPLPFGSHTMNEEIKRAPKTESEEDIEGSAARKNADLNLVDASKGFKGYPNTGSRIETQSPVAMMGGRNLAGHAGNTSPLPGALIASSKVEGAPPALAAKTQIDIGFHTPTIHGNRALEDGPVHFEPSSGSDSQFENKTDLRQFLPGGSRAAGRHLAGSAEINPKEENLFLRISNKIMEKCRLGVLWQCQ